MKVINFFDPIITIQVISILTEEKGKESQLTAVHLQPRSAGRTRSTGAAELVTSAPPATRADPVHLCWIWFPYGNMPQFRSRRRAFIPPSTTSVISPWWHVPTYNSAEKASCFWANAAEKMLATECAPWSLPEMFWYGREGQSPEHTSLCGQLYKTAIRHTWWIHHFRIAATEAIYVHSLRLSEAVNVKQGGCVCIANVRSTQGTRSAAGGRTRPKRSNWKVGTLSKRTENNSVKQIQWKKKKKTRIQKIKLKKKDILKNLQELMNSKSRIFWKIVFSLNTVLLPPSITSKLEISLYITIA